MTDLLLFHHALGLTPGVRALAATFEAAGHVVHLPDLYDGEVLRDVESGVARAREIGFDTLLERGVAAAQGLPERLVVAGISLGVMPAQLLAQTRPGTAGALFLEACLPPDEFGGWPEGLPVQVHGMDRDPSFAGEGDLAAARELVGAATDAELFLYPGDAHLFTDAGLPAYDAEAVRALTDRALDFLDRVG